jgi:hypothetical protein
LLISNTTAAESLTAIYNVLVTLKAALFIFYCNSNSEWVPIALMGNLGIRLFMLALILLKAGIRLLTIVYHFRAINTPVIGVHATVSDHHLIL